MNKVINILTVAIQIGATLITMFVLFMIFALLDYRGGIEGLIGILIFQPIMAIVFSLLTIFICVIIGLPLRLHRRLNIWWRTKFYISLVLVIIGLTMCIVSFMPSMIEEIEYNQDGIIQFVTVPNMYLVSIGWFMLAFGILHSFLPYKLQLMLSDWLDNRKKNFSSETN